MIDPKLFKALLETVDQNPPAVTVDELISIPELRNIIDYLVQRWAMSYLMEGEQIALGDSRSLAGSAFHLGFEVGLAYRELKPK